MTEYVCDVCGEAILDEDPHTNIETGGDCHEACCIACAEDKEADARGQLAREDARSGAADWED